MVGGGLSSQPGVETLRPDRTRRMRWMLLVTVPLIVLVIAIHIAGLRTLAAVLTPLAGITLVVLGAWALKSRG